MPSPVAWSYRRVAAYTASGDSCNADKPLLWPLGQFTDLTGDCLNFDLHPDGKRFAVLKAPARDKPLR